MVKSRLSTLQLNRHAAVVIAIQLLAILVGCESNIVVESKSVVQPDSATEATVTPLEPLHPFSPKPEPVAESLVTSQRSLVIVVCPVPFQNALQPWIQRREREGLEVVVVDSQPTAGLMKQSLTKTNHGHCDYILLVGDSQYTPNNEPCDPAQYVPTIYRNADVTAPYQEAPQLPGDYSYGDFEDDGMVEAAVGRIPAKTPEQLTAFINRIVACEDSTDFGRWRSRVDLVAGIGGFGAMIDGAIEMVAGGIITGCLPGSVRTRITHASPTSDFHPGTDEFTATVLKNYKDGARFWVYAGHGWVNELDRVPSTQFGRPVLSISDLPNLHRDQSSAPIALMLACYTGAYDLPEDCLAEAMLLSAEGPIAILAGSRVTMPYGNAATAIGLIHAMYKDQTLRLGDAWLTTLNEMTTPTNSNPALQQRRMMVDGIAAVLGGGARTDDERREHRQLYNWLGDPTLRIDSGGKVEFQDSGAAIIGQSWTLQGTTPIAGTMTVEIHRRLGTPIQPQAAATSRYIAANDTVIATQALEVEPGVWTCHFSQLPTLINKSDSSIPIIVKVDVVGTTGFASGSLTAWLRP